MKYFYFFGLLILLPVITHAQQPDSLTIKEEEDELHHKNHKVLFTPIVLYAPEESFVLGGGGIFLFRPKHRDSLIYTRTSNIQGSLLYTLKHQLITQPNYTIFTKGEQFLFKGTFGYSRFPIYYYGIGDNTSKQHEQISYDIVSNDHNIFYKLKPYMYAGIGFRYYRVWDVSSPTDGILETTKPPGYNGYIASGPTFAISYDSRNNVLTTSRGFNLNISQTFHGSAFGGNFNFSRTLIDIRKFYKLFDQTSSKNILALQLYSQFTAGDVPFNELSKIGGNMIMRGYYLGRYRDKDLISAQAEYRRRLLGRFGVVVFLALGEVAPRMKDFNLFSSKASYGGGLRFRVSKKHNVNLRGDFGFDNHGNALIYFAIAEAF